jgi:DNA-directed RNA polymerase subunit RPC12/RpoP
MTSHKLNLLENALDSLAESLRKFQEGDAGDKKAYKFTVLHLAHFVELVLKHHVAQKHPLLIFQNPFAKQLDRNKTIGLWEAVNFINNENSESIDSELRADLEWLKKLRNEIEHHKFEMDVPEVRRTVGRLFRSMLVFLETVPDLNLKEKIPENAMSAFKILSDEYEFNRNEAVIKADQIEAESGYDHNDPDARPSRLHCSDCDSNTLVADEAAEYGYKCIFCESETSDLVPVSCSNCGADCELGDMTFWEDEEIGREMRCDYCSGKHLMWKDD